MYKSYAKWMKIWGNVCIHTHSQMHPYAIDIIMHPFSLPVFCFDCFVFGFSFNYIFLSFFHSFPSIETHYNVNNNCFVRCCCCFFFLFVRLLLVSSSFSFHQIKHHSIVFASTLKWCNQTISLFFFFGFIYLLMRWNVAYLFSFNKRTRCILFTAQVIVSNVEYTHT